MTTPVKAIYEGGVFKPLQPLHLAELTPVEVLIPSEAAADQTEPAGWSAMDDLIGFIHDAPADMAEHHNRYLYGKP